MNEVISELRSRGYSYQFKVRDKSIYCEDYNISFKELDITEVYNFEMGDSDTYNTLYAVKCTRYNISGVIISLSDMYANSFSKVVIQKIANNVDFKYKHYTCK